MTRSDHIRAPETRNSLLLQVRDHANAEAWEEFAAIYRPVICRLAVLKGLQPADAEDLAQQVLVSVAKAINRWEPDSDRAKFRTWLRRVADNAILNALTRRRPDRGAGDIGDNDLLSQQAVHSGPDSGLLRIEYRREVFAQAAQQIRGEFSDDTWAAFWMTAVDNIEINAAARKLGRTRGSVYAARSRVMKRLKQKIEDFDDPIEPS